VTPGERWVREELLALRGGGFSLAAWGRFLDAAARRANRTRRERPGLARQAHAWRAVGLATGVPVCRLAGRTEAPAPGAGRWALWWLAASVMVDWHLGMVEGPAGEPRERLAAADAVSLSRIGLVPFHAASGNRGAGSAAWFAAIVVASGLTDLLDGRLARRGGPTRLGRELDATADVLASLAATRTAYRAGWLGPAAATLGTLRTLAPAAAVATSYFATGKRPKLDPVGRPFGPLALAGLAITAKARRIGGALVSGAALATLLRALARVGGTPDLNLSGLGPDQSDNSDPEESKCNART
jgi:phosphatidylglycerophosphate synthase